MVYQEMKVRVLTTTPIVLTEAHASQVMTETQQEISGSMMRGLLAQRYIQYQKLGKDAHRDKAFRKLFFKDLRFTPSMPLKDGKRSFVLPLSLQKSKMVNQDGVPEIQDLLTIPQGEKAKLGFKSLKGLAIQTEAGLQTVSVSTRISLHMTRSDAHRRILGSSQDGGIFNYEAIDADQAFEGSILGTAEALRQLRQGLGLDEGQGFAGQLGRSRFTEYGGCRITLAPVEAASELSKKDIQDRTICLRFDTPYLPAGEEGDLTQTADAAFLLAPFVQEMGEGFSIEKIFSASVETGGFVGVWGLPQPSSCGLAAGTVFSLQKDCDWTDEDIRHLGEIIYRGLGSRTVEGYGQLRIWNLERAVMAPRKKRLAYQERRLPKDIVIPDTVRKQVMNILQRRIAESLKEQAYDDVFGSNGDRGIAVQPNDKNFFSRLSALLEASRAEGGSLRKNLEDKIRQERQPKDNLQRNKQSKSITPFAHRLSTMSVRGYFLEKYFTAGARLPYATLIDNRLAEPRIQALLDAVSGDARDFDFTDGKDYYEYWRWFFRYARKKCAGQHRDGKERF